MAHDSKAECDKVVIVTGGSSGIGLATCCALASKGACVIVVGRDSGRLRRAVEQIKEYVGGDGDPENILAVAADVRSERAMVEMVDTTVGSFGRVDVLVASAGMLRTADSRPDLLANLSVSEFEKILDINVKGVFLSNRAVLETMISQRSGQIINISSLSGRKALPLDAAYCASKFAVVGLTESLAEEVRSYGIKVHTVLPGNTDTPIWHQNRILPRSVNVISPDRVADVILLLIKSEGSVMCSDVSIFPSMYGGKKYEM